jgi:DNA-binding LacI/PurR family transcriptional regulator
MKTFKYLMVRDYIKKRFIDNPGCSGEIPSEPILAQKLKTSRFPVNQAVTCLVEEGLLTRIDGIGTFIAGKEPAHLKGRNAGSQILLAFVSQVGAVEQELLQGFQDCFFNKNIMLTNVFQEAETTSWEFIIDKVRTSNIKGIFLSPKIHFGNARSPSLDFAQHLSEEGVPVVVVDRPLPGFLGPQVVTDNTGGVLQTVQELVRNGQGVIACFGKDDYIVGKERLMGYELGLEYCGLPVDDSLLVLDHSGADFFPTLDALIDKGVAKVFARHPDCRRFVAFNISFAYRLYRKLRKSGFLTEDTIIAGFDPSPYYDNDFMKHYLVIKRPLRKIGQEAAELMLNQLGNGEPANEIRRIKPDLILPEEFNMAHYRHEAMLV